MPQFVASRLRPEPGRAMSGESEQSANLIHVGQDEALPDVLERLHGHRGESLTLVIAEHSPILLTATEFRALKELTDRQHIRLGLETDDPLRVQLASMFGLAERKAQPHADPSEPASYGSSFGSWRHARRPKPRVPGQPPESIDADVEKDHSRTSDDPIAVSRRRRNDLYKDSARRDAPKTDSSYIDDAGLDYIPDEDNGQERSRAWLYGRIAAALLVILAIGAVALWYWFPAVQVDMTLRTASVSTDIVYSVADPNADIPSDSQFTVEAAEETADVPFRIEIPTSGIAREPDGTASGPMVFRSTAEEAITLEEGTEITAVDGVTYVLTEDVEVPSGMLEGPGEAEGRVTAAQAGSVGNREAGTLTGKVSDVDVFYSNLNGAIDGGTDREFPVVTAEDRAAAERAVQEDLRPAAVEGWEEQLPEGMAVVGPSVQPGDPNFTIEGEIDDRRDSVIVSGTVPVTGLIYDIGEVEQQARETFEVALQEQVPPGYGLDVSTITLGEPELVAESPENVEYRVGANATARAIFDEGAQEGLKDRVAGADADRARETVDSVGAIESWEMSQSPEWWPDRMPQSPNRVTINIVDSLEDEDAATAPAGSPESTPEGGS